jgi:hypothetical protein
MDRAALVTTAYDALIDVIAQLDEEMSWLPTACLGWSVGDLVHHCTMDAQRALVALHTPADRAADTDSVDYWRGWGTDPEADDRGRRDNRVRARVAPPRSKAGPRRPRTGSVSRGVERPRRRARRHRASHPHRGTTRTARACR